MRDQFLEDGPDMAQGTQVVGPDMAQDIREAILGHQVCPFCGAVVEQTEQPCPHCTMENTSASRQATKSRIGPWYVLQARNPAAPGMKFETLLAFAHKGRVKARSIVRGPTTYQLWRFAAQVKGLSREFGVCYSCGGAIDRSTGVCPNCNRSQEPPANPDVFLEGQETEAAAGRTPVFRELGGAPMVAEEIGGSAAGTKPPKAPADSAAHSSADRSRARKNTDGFLTAQDLAAAFKLNFKPKGRGRSAIHDPQEAWIRVPPGKRRRWGRYIVVVLLLGAIAAGAYGLHHDPELRSKGLDLGAQAVAWAKQKWSQLHQSARHDHTAPSADHLRVDVPVAAAKPASLPATQPAVQPSPWDLLYAQKEAQASSATVPPPPVKKYRDGTIDDVRELYRAAIDAEAQGDYAMAVKKYQQIKEFPPDLRPRDLDLRLKEARRQAQ